MADKQVRLDWYCGHNLPGTGGFFEEPDECGTYFTTYMDLDEYEDCGASAMCPECSAQLSKEYDCPEIARVDRREAGDEQQMP